MKRKKERPAERGEGDYSFIRIFFLSLIAILLAFIVLNQDLRTKYFPVFNWQEKAELIKKELGKKTAEISPQILPKKPPLKILFLGNSYTAVNDLPGMVREISKSDPNNKFEFEIDSVAEGGATILSLWKGGHALEKLRSQHWDYVILQNQSQWALFEKDTKESYTIAQEWREELAKNSSHSLLYVTWPRKPGSHWYSDSEGYLYKNPEYMQNMFDEKSNILAKILQVEKAIMVGDIWMEFMKDNSDINLYNDDGSHPSIAGTYLTALVFYNYIAKGSDVAMLKYAPQELTPAQIEAIKRTVILF